MDSVVAFHNLMILLTT